jgi:hypothetical protein
VTVTLDDDVREIWRLELRALERREGSLRPLRGPDTPLCDQTLEVRRAFESRDWFSALRDHDDVAAVLDQIEVVAEVLSELANADRHAHDSSVHLRSSKVSL